MEVEAQYDSKIVKKSIHLIRDPFDNVVSRFHLSVKRHQNDPMWLENHPQNVTGFRKWCDTLSWKYNEQLNTYITKEVLDSAKNVPCNADFFRYIKWHNHALTVIENLKLPVHTLYYEDYKNDFNETLSGVLSFLELPNIGKPDPFIFRSYFDYFSSDERVAACNFMKRLASNATLDILSRYMGRS